MAGERQAPSALPPRKTRYPLYRRLGGPQGRSGQVWKISPPTGIRFPDRPARSQSLYRLSYRGPLENKYTDIKFNENPLSGNRVVPCGRTDGQTERQTDVET